MSDTIFTEQDPAQPVVEAKPTITIPQEAVDFVGEGKKYKSVEDALKSVPHAQQHIQTLEQELAQTREELTKRKTTEELLAELKSNTNTVATTTAPVLDTEVVAQLVAQTIEKKEAEKVSQLNIKTVVENFTQAFGEKAEEKYSEIAREAGLSVQMLNQLAASSPVAVLKLAGLSKQPTVSVGKIQSSVNTETMQTKPNQELSARVPKGATTKDLVAAWKAAGEKVKQQS